MGQMDAPYDIEYDPSSMRRTCDARLGLVKVLNDSHGIGMFGACSTDHTYVIRASICPISRHLRLVRLLVVGSRCRVPVPCVRLCFNEAGVVFPVLREKFAISR